MPGDTEIRKPLPGAIGMRWLSLQTLLANRSSDLGFLRQLEHTNDRIYKEKVLWSSDFHLMSGFYIDTKVLNCMIELL